MRVSLEWLREFVDIRSRPEVLADRLTMSGVEVESIERIRGQAVFELGVAPNRGDLLSVVGVAREIAAVSGKRFHPPSVRPPRGEGGIRKHIDVSVRHRSLCPRYCARAIRGIEIKPSPSWMAERLTACGIRAINNIVDATNYVMLETGQPLHAFDLRFIRKGCIHVRKAGEAMDFTTLDGAKRELVADDLLICDGEGPLALAGVMGGENSEVRGDTSDILLESAFFDPMGTRRTSRRLGLATESSRRFERSVDPNTTLASLHRVTEIIIEIAGGVATSDWVDIYPRRIRPRRIPISESEVERILGIKLSSAVIGRLLGRLDLKVARQSSGALSVAVPTFRPDLTRPVDLAEEVARLNGYESIPETMPVKEVVPISYPRFCEQEVVVRDSLVGSGLTEAVLYGFTSEENLELFADIGATKVRIANPLSGEQTAMCTTLVPNLLDAIKLNLNRQRRDCRLFALQHVYYRPMPIGPSEEPRQIAGAMVGRRYPVSWERSRETLDFYDAKGVVENLIDALGLARQTIYQHGHAYRFLHPGSFAYVVCGGKRVGFVGQIHPDIAARWEIGQDVFAFEMHFELLAEMASSRATRYQEISRFPFVDHDLALVVEEGIEAAEVERAIHDCGAKLIEKVSVFDVYRGDGVAPGHKSIALTLRFAAADRTLTDGEVSEAKDRVVRELKSRLGAELRT